MINFPICRKLNIYAFNIIFNGDFQLFSFNQLAEWLKHFFYKSFRIIYWNTEIQIKFAVSQLLYANLIFVIHMKNLSWVQNSIRRFFSSLYSFNYILKISFKWSYLILHFFIKSLENTNLTLSFTHGTFRDGISKFGIERRKNWTDFGLNIHLNLSQLL